MTAPPPLDAGRVRGLIFDLDGTLVDSYPAIASSVNHARARFALPPLEDGEVRRRVGRGLESLMEDVVGPGRVEEGVRLFREHYAAVYAEGTSPLPGALSTLRALHRRGYRLGVASNKPARFGEPILEQLGMRRFLAVVHGPDTAGATKPDPAMLHLCLEAMGVKAADAAYVGDMVLDVETAARAGLPVLLVPGGSSRAEDLGGTRQRILGSIGELLDILPATAGGLAVRRVATGDSA